MKIDFDPERWPDLSAFRNACLEDNHTEMSRIAGHNHHGYPNENPENLSMEKLAAVYKARHYASENDLPSLQSLLEREPWVVNHGWTCQGWLPLTQAACAHGSRELVTYVLSKGADPSLTVGDAGEKSTAADMARVSGHTDLADWLGGL